MAGIFDRSSDMDDGRHEGQRVAAGGLPGPTDGNGPDIHTRSFRNADGEGRKRRGGIETKRTEDGKSRSKEQWEASEKEKKLHALPPSSSLFLLLRPFLVRARAKLA